MTTGVVTHEPRDSSPAGAPRLAWIVRAVSAVTVLACLATAVGLGIRWWPDSMSVRYRTPAAELSSQQLATFQAFAAGNAADAPIVLSYHDVLPAGGDGTSIYTVTPEQLDEHMAMLAASGFTAISQQQMVEYLHGVPVPPRSVYITFDDGAKGIWQYADRILERHGFRATGFIITGSVGTNQPYYLTWGEMERMRDNGRWDFAAHTDAGHVRVPVDASGRTAPFLTNRQWLASEQRQESLDEWRDRVRSDLAANIETMIDHGFDRPLLFAHPFAAVTAPTNDAAIPIELDRIVEGFFEASVANDPAAATVAPSDISQRHLRRVAVRAATTTDELFERLRQASDA